jgi:hypothetical protein
MTHDDRKLRRSVIPLLAGLQACLLMAAADEMNNRFNLRQSIASSQQACYRGNDCNDLSQCMTNIIIVSIYLLLTSQLILQSKMI